MIKQPKQPDNIDQQSKLVKSFHKIQVLVDELNKKEIPEVIQDQINQKIEKISAFSGSDVQLSKLISGTYREILKLVRKELGIVPRHFYQNLWMALGLSVFGVPLGFVYAAATDNPGLFSVGIAMGLPIGLAIGMQMDKKKEREGKQIQIN